MKTVRDNIYLAIAAFILSFGLILIANSNMLIEWGF